MNDAEKKRLKERIAVLENVLNSKISDQEEFIKQIKEEVWKLKTSFGLWD